MAANASRAFRSIGVLCRILVIGVIAASGALWPAGPVAAQDTAEPEAIEAPTSPPIFDATPAPESFPILVIRQSTLFSETAAARSIAEQVANAESELDADLDVVGESLRTRERELSDLRTTLPKEEFDALAAEFERDVRAFYARSQRERGLVDQAERDARNKLQRAAQEVLIEIMRQRNALVMLNEEQIVLSRHSLDVTQEAIARLDEVAPRIELQLPESENPAQP